MAAKIHIITKMPSPVDVLGVRSLLGLAGYYRKFVPNFSSLAKPLNELAQSNTVFEWTQARQHAFQALNDALTSTPVLRSRDFNCPFELHTDWAKKDLGAVLISEDDANSEYIVVYTIRSNN